MKTINNKNIIKNTNNELAQKYILENIIDKIIKNTPNNSKASNDNITRVWSF